MNEASGRNQTNKKSVHRKDVWGRENHGEKGGDGSRHGTPSQASAVLTLHHLLFTITLHHHSSSSLFITLPSADLSMSTHSVRPAAVVSIFPNCAEMLCGPSPPA